MNIFGVGGTELVLIVLIMLVVAGPKRMLQWSYYAGKYLAQLRILWSQAMETVQKELDESGVDIKLPKDIPTRGDIARLASQAMKPLQEPMQEVIDEYQKEHKKVADTLNEEKQKITQSTNYARVTRVNSNGHKKLPEKTETDTPASGASNDFGTWSGLDSSTDSKEE